ncbi:hypothetical protein I203_106801 [Kwoniella mangroviensis CBS 8507]|uniref:uncharacterized protein n=1 Tax=Kwoniella mangroviensis CBS 8507 TaxID=1296122 RepID=UPI00080D6888|nr:uncharacterized protein I203_07888 [Kwoniella mangroviensis CBS 8507]OCF63152.1 hypothetical protein I203_07888 [Kwoniella mangroviensis CBS 8507]
MSADQSRNRMDEDISRLKSWTSSPICHGSTSRGSRRNWHRAKSDQTSRDSKVANTGYKANSSQDWRSSTDWRKREKEPGLSSEPPRKRYALEVEAFECNLNQAETDSNSIFIKIQKEVLKSLFSVMPYSDTFDRRPWFNPLDEDRRKALIQKAVEQDMINLKDILVKNNGDEQAVQSFYESSAGFEGPSELLAKFY